MTVKGVGSSTPNLSNGTGIAPIANGGTGSATGFTYGNQMLFSLLGVDMTTTTDHAFTKIFSGTNYMVTHVVATRVSGAASVTCVGGIYTAASKGGDALVAATQSYVTLASGIIVNAVLAAIAGTASHSATPILTLTTGSTAACSANVYIFGVCID